MNTQEVFALLDVIGEVQHRNFNEIQTTVWTDALDDLDFNVAMAALNEIVRESDDFITPSAVRQQANRIADERIRTQAERCRPPSELADDQYLAWFRSLRGALIRGDTIPEATRHACAAIGVAPPDMHASVAAPTFSPRSIEPGGTVVGEVVGGGQRDE